MTIINVSEVNGATNLQRQGTEVGHLIVPMFDRVHVTQTDILWDQTGTNEFPKGSGTASRIYRIPVDLTRYDQMRLSFHIVSGAASASTASLHYAPADTGALTGHVGSASPTLSLTGTNVRRDTGWVDMNSGAQASVWLAILQTATGSAGTTREITRMVAEFRATSA